MLLHHVPYLELQVVVALTDDMELSPRDEPYGYRRQDALLGVKFESGVLPLPAYVHQVVGLRGVAPQEEGHLGLVDAAVLRAEPDLD